MWTYGKYLSISRITIDNPNLIPNGTLLDNITYCIGQIKIIVRTGRTFDTPPTFDGLILPHILWFIVHLDTEFLGNLLYSVQVMI